jgi:acetate kinase
MRIVALNCGSSTLKFKVLELDRCTPVGGEKNIAQGSFERIGSTGTIKLVAEGDERFQETAITRDHADATLRVIDLLSSTPSIRHGGIGAVGHRVVHGGHLFTGPVLLNDEIIGAIEAVKFLAPLHNEPSLVAIRAAREALGPSIPMVAIFDTAFHSAMPERASRYAIPQGIASRHHIRRYGFHGIAHRYMVDRYAAMTGTPRDGVNLVTLQLGNGCSASAIKGGSSMDTSMGFTPLEGLMMGTRSGSIDPHLPGFLARMEDVDMDRVEEWLNRKSGLLGVSEYSEDMRELLEAEKAGDAKAGLAVEMFCYGVRKQIGAYLASLGGADALIFGGGIGENAAEVRRRICGGMEWCGLVIDEAKNSATVGIEGQISADNSKIQAYVVPVDEEAVIARDTLRCLEKGETKE